MTKHKDILKLKKSYLLNIKLKLILIQYKKSNLIKK